MAGAWGMQECISDMAAPGAMAGRSKSVRFDFTGLDELRQHVRTARPTVAWEGVQLCREPVCGSVVATAGAKARLISTRAIGDYEMEGALSASNLVFVVGVDLCMPGMVWQTEVHTGAAMVVQPGADTHSLLRKRSNYLTIDISREALESELQLYDIGSEPAALNASGVLKGRLADSSTARIRSCVAALHQHGDSGLPPGFALDQLVLSALVEHLSRSASVSQSASGRSYQRIVARARDYVEAHIEQPISLDELCHAACASKRTLHRAFLEVTSDTPQHYILKLRLNRIRRDLASNDEAERTVTVVSMRWGITELGRLASRYRDQFGELPSDTLRRRKAPTFVPAPHGPAALVMPTVCAGKPPRTAARSALPRRQPVSIKAIACEA